LDILDDLYLEYTTSYIYLYTILSGLKESNQLTPDVVDTAKTRLENLTRHNDEDVAKRNNITPEFLQQWIAKFSGDARVAKVLRDIDDLAEQVLVKQQVKEIHFELPEKLTRETYLQIARKVQAAVRHSIYNHMKRLGKDKLTNEEMDELCEKIKAEEQEGFRLKAMQLFNVELPSSAIPKRVL